MADSACTPKPLGVDEIGRSRAHAAGRVYAETQAVHQHGADLAAILDEAIECVREMRYAYGDSDKAKSLETLRGLRFSATAHYNAARDAMHQADLQMSLVQEGLDGAHTAYIDAFRVIIDDPKADPDALHPDLAHMRDLATTALRRFAKANPALTTAGDRLDHIDNLLVQATSYMRKCERRWL